MTLTVISLHSFTPTSWYQFSLVCSVSDSWCMFFVHCCILKNDPHLYLNTFNYWLEFDQFTLNPATLTNTLGPFIEGLAGRSKGKKGQNYEFLFHERRIKLAERFMVARVTRLRRVIFSPNGLFTLGTYVPTCVLENNGNSPHFRACLLHG
jgi:hypothetical protein